ncbi:MAG TPA: GNAT family N-acetyltransferase, partial [Woeseiaceae bacterium]|nr:GNAT family N-acetyltransferase [Woeseiaceae bacterium]
PPGRCQPTLCEQAAMLPALLHGRMLHRFGPLLCWLHAWSRRDAAAPPHWHLGPAAVHRQQRGQGIGSALLGELCARLDSHEGCGYLETDKPENVRLYRRFGFEIHAEQDVLGVRNWFILRCPRTSTPAHGAPHAPRSGSQ